PARRRAKRDNRGRVVSLFMGFLKAKEKPGPADGGEFQGSSWQRCSQMWRPAGEVRIVKAGQSRGRSCGFRFSRRRRPGEPIPCREEGPKHGENAHRRSRPRFSRTKGSSPDQRRARGRYLHEGGG